MNQQHVTAILTQRTGGGGGPSPTKNRDSRSVVRNRFIPAPPRSPGPPHLHPRYDRCGIDGPSAQDDEPLQPQHEVILGLE